MTERSQVSAVADRDLMLVFGDASSVHLHRWVQAMAERGFEVVVGTRRPATLPGACEVIAIRPGGNGLGWFAALPTVRSLARRLRPRWVHGHYVTSYGLWAAAAAAAVAAPLVQTAWGSDLLVTPKAPGWPGRWMRALVRHNLRRADLFTADAQEMLAEARTYGLPARCEEVLWGVDTERFLPGVPAPGFEIASLRAWEPNYRIDAVLHAFAELRTLRPALQAALHLLGGGSEAATLQALARRLGVADTVYFTGRVDDATMVATLQRCRVSVSVPQSDATSVSVLESMACGLPVLASDLPANRQWLPGECLVTGTDAQALGHRMAGRLIAWADDPARAAALGAMNRARVEPAASRRVQMDRMATLYRALLEQRR